MSTGQANQSNQQQKILILAAIPHGLRLDREISEIEDAIRRATKRDLFEIRIRTAVRSQNIRRAIAEEKPQIVHFCGHGLKDGSLLLEDEGGHNKSVSPEGLASLFRLHANYVNCVVLNACHSAKTAEAISKYINYVIGMNQPIGDQARSHLLRDFTMDWATQFQTIKMCFKEHLRKVRNERKIKIPALRSYLSSPVV